MNKCTHIGLDVHKDTIAVAVLRPGTTEVDERVVPNTPEAIRRLLARHDPRLTSICYEAGPTGYDTHRLITSLGFACDVIAPSLIPRRSGSRVKTDRIDARNLARLHRAGELTCVRVPDAAEEAVRDLIRVREEVKCDRGIARQRIRSFLMRYGKRYPGASDRWSFRFEVWARAVTFDEPLAQEAFSNLLSAYFIRDAQLAAMTARIEELAQGEPFSDGLRALRGIDTLSAMTIISETCDFFRFPDAGSYMGVHRAHALRALERSKQTPGLDHKDRQPAHQARARGGRLGVPARARSARQAQGTARWAGPRRRRVLVGGTMPAQHHVSPPCGQKGAAHRGGSAQASLRRSARPPGTRWPRRRLSRRAPPGLVRRPGQRGSPRRRRA